MLAARWAVPLPDPDTSGGLPIDGLSPSVRLVFDVLPGAIHVARLAADLARSDRTPRWVRLAPYDIDRPALDTLAHATLDSVVASAGDQPVVVVESDDHRQAELFLARLATAEPTEPPSCAVVLRYCAAGEDRKRMTRRHQVIPRRGRNDKALEYLTRGRPALHDSVLDAARWLRPGELVDIIERTGRLDDLTTRIAARLVQSMPPRTTTLLDFVALLGYCNRSLRSLEPVLDACADLPWWTELTGGWRRFEPAWRDAVHAVCRSDRRPQVPLLGRLVCELGEEGAIGAAIELCFDAGYPGTASDMLLGFGPDLCSAGQPLAVRRWLRRLPRVLRHRHRGLAVEVQTARRAAAEALAIQPRPSPARQRSADVMPAAFSGWRLGSTRPVDSSQNLLGGACMALEARLLGSVDVALGGHQVKHWHGRNGTLLLAYLLLHRARPVPRDVLAVAFWPDAPPDACRNRLHVTMHALRADLQAASPTPVVIFEDGYRLNTELDIRLDIEEFERAIARGKQAERENDVEAALAAYRCVVREYRGDLLSDHPYSEWALLPREHYRFQMLDALGRAARLAFDTGRYPESVKAGQRLLALDFCREDLHRLVMRAYARLGQPHRALRQFELCLRQLRQELDMAPAQETIELYSRIRRRSMV
jgi:DNA-binding SARP family transcriptional activator